LHSRHDLRSIDAIEERTGFIGNRLCNQSFAGTGRAVEQDTLGRLDTEHLEEGWMSERKLNHFANLGELLAHTTHVVISNPVLLLFFVSDDGFALSEHVGFISDRSVVARLDSSNFEFDWSELSSDSERVALGHGTESVSEVGHDVSLGKVTGQAFNRVSERKDLDVDEVGALGQRAHFDGVAESHSQILTAALIHSNLAIWHVVVVGAESDAHSLAALFTYTDISLICASLPLRST